MSTVHELKTDPEVFQLSWDGKKPWEIRFNDRDYKVGDRLILLETKYSGEDIAGGKPLKYTGRQIQALITAIVEGYGLEKGWVILSVCIEERICQEVCERLSLSDVLKAAAPEQIQEALCDEYTPEVGDKCWLNWIFAGNSIRAEITYMGDGVGCCKTSDDKEFAFALTDVSFTPIKSEREEIIEKIEVILSNGKSCITTYKQQAVAIYNHFNITEKGGEHD